MKSENGENSRGRASSGSALILAVVLTSLLAIVGVFFVMVARVDKMATSAVSQNRALDLAVDTAVEQISQQLVLDVPGVAGQEYHDYPGAADRWLASLEPNDNGWWQQISDVTWYLQARGWATRDIPITNGTPNPLFRAVIEDKKPIALAADGSLLEQLADADGDGVADSKWIELAGMTSTKGERIFVAMRILDNGGLLNANTHFKFDPYDPCVAHVDGSSLLQVNLRALGGPRGQPPPSPDIAATDLLAARANYGRGLDPCDLSRYEANVIWRYGDPNGPYTPFDISDELEFRYRFLVNHPSIDTRLEDWGSQFRVGTLMTPVGAGGRELANWFKRASDNGSLDPNYAFRHLTTTCSVDRIINPRPIVRNDPNRTLIRQMVNVNTADKVMLHDAVMAGLLDANPGLNPAAADMAAAQIAINIIDYRDPDSEVTYYDVNSTRLYGFERPCVYISELTSRFVRVPPNTYRSYAIELYKPYFEDEDPNASEWQLVIDGKPIPISWSGTRRFHVVRFEDPRTLTNLLTPDFNDPYEPADPSIYGYKASDYAKAAQDAGYTTFDANSAIYLERKVRGVGLVVDSIKVPGGWMATDGQVHGIQRDITRHKCLRRLWDELGTKKDSPTLGAHNSFVHADTVKVQAHPYLDPRLYRGGGFKNIGEIGMVFVKNMYDETVVRACTEAGVRLDLANPAFRGLFHYLTVFDPTVDGIDNDDDGWGFGSQVDPNELKIRGRINVNTAPWFVIEQLPWMTPAIARSVAGYRDTVSRGFGSITELMQVPEMRYYASPAEPNDLDRFPDLTPSDGAANDFEERDVIFQRISNLITVRSDVFTAYILVRIGTDGPQRRVIAILDRSNVYSNLDKVRGVALHPVPEPR